MKICNLCGFAVLLTPKFASLFAWITMPFTVIQSISFFKKNFFAYQFNSRQYLTDHYTKQKTCQGWLWAHFNFKLSFQGTSLGTLASWAKSQRLCKYLLYLTIHRGKLITELAIHMQIFITYMIFPRAAKVFGTRTLGECISLKRTYCNTEVAKFPQ